MPFASCARAGAWVVCVAAVPFLLLAAPARANGRYPLADQVVIDPVNPSHIVARATFGLLDSDDGGKTFRWICETAIGYIGVEDPPIAVTANGSAVVVSSKGISVSSDGGCAWVRNAGLTGQWFGVDVTAVHARPHEALALLSSFADGAYTVSIVKTVDDGATWNEVIASLGTSFLATTLEVAPSDPNRVYVSGKVLPGSTTAIMRSDDGGRTFTQFPLQVSPADSIYIGAVDPRDPDIVYLRTNSDDVGRVLVSKDGASSWTEIWQAPGDVSGFALSPDGSVVAVGGTTAGVAVASTSDYAFRKSSNVAAYCLTFWGERLLACAKEAIDHFSIGVSDDLGEHFDALLHLPDVLPRECPSGTSAAICGLDWPMVAGALGVPSSTAGDGGTTDAGDAGARSEGGACGCRLSSNHAADERGWGSLIGALFATAVAVARGRCRMRRSRV